MRAEAAAGDEAGAAQTTSTAATSAGRLPQIMDDELNRKRTLTLLSKERPTDARRGQDRFNHGLLVADAVADLFAQYCKRQKQTLFPADRQTVEQLWHAGVWHERLWRGWTFDALADVTDWQVASWVADISPDPRMPAPKRHQDYLCRLSAASFHVQLVKLCDIRYELSELHDRLKPGKRRDPTEEHLAATRYAECLRSLPRLVTYGWLAREIDELAVTCAALCDGCDRLRREASIEANVLAGQARRDKAANDRKRRA